MSGRKTLCQKIKLCTKNVSVIFMCLIFSPELFAQADFDLTGEWLIDGKGICATLLKSGKDYKVKDCGDSAYKNKYVKIGTNKYIKNNFVFWAKDASHIQFIAGSSEKWTKKSGISEHVQQMPPLLALEKIVLSKNILNAGETIQLSITIKNLGEGDANDVGIYLDSDLKGLEYSQKTICPPISKRDGSVTVNIDLIGGLDLATAEAVLKIEIVEPKFKVKIQGKQVKFPTREFIKPDLILAKFAVIENLSANPNNQVDINEQIDVKFAVQNIGQGNAEKVNLLVNNNQNGVMFLGVVDAAGNLIRKNPLVPEINSGKFETVTFRYFVNSEFTSSKLTFTIIAGEKHGKFGLAQAKSVEINKTLKEEGEIMTVVSKEDAMKPHVIIEDIPDFVSDVDENIPQNAFVNDKSFAVVIGNENYNKEIKVKYALNDARVFKQYLEKTLGLPAKNIYYIENATYGQLLDALKWINDVAKAYNGEAKIIFYYAGHGMPDEKTKTSFLLPVDGNSQNIVTAIKLEEIYAKLNEFTSTSVTVFLDACFSGSARDAGDNMLAQGRGVKIKTRNETLSGKTFVMSASSGDETALPYSEKHHGLFTYFLLKKIQATRGDVTLSELSNFIITNVSQQSVLVNKKTQTPQANTSKEIESSWQALKLN